MLGDYTYEKVGSNRTQFADVRFIFATNHDLEQMKDKGSFRKDLFFRINKISIKLPALRERIDDLPLLVDHFNKLHSNRLGRRPVLMGRAMSLLYAYDWPGNVRELSNLIERLCIQHAGEEINEQHLPPEIVKSKSRPDARKKVLEAQEKSRLERDYLKNKKNISATARELGLPYATLRYKLKKYRLI